jgi:hypothetical protein
MESFNWQSYQQFVESNLTIVNKDGVEVPYLLNEAQVDFLKNITGRDIILKARQLGFSSLILAVMTTRFLLKRNERLVCISHEAGATQRLLDRVKFYIGSYEKKNGIKIPMKYNSRNEMNFSERNNTFYIGTAGSKTFGRGDTISVLHGSEAAFYDDINGFMAGAVQAVVPSGLVFLETTANGFNDFKNLWDRSEKNESGYKTHFYSPKWEYGPEFLETKKRELKDLYLQEYPENAIEAFVNSGNMYFSRKALQHYLLNIGEPINKNLIYV